MKPTMDPTLPPPVAPGPHPDSTGPVLKPEPAEAKVDRPTTTPAAVVVQTAEEILEGLFGDGPWGSR